jgi:hypothetical protein
MTEQLILSQIKQLPDSLKVQIADYIEFLVMKYSDSIKEERLKSNKRVSHFGNAKGQVVMSDDFNEPLEDFAEYM